MRFSEGVGFRAEGLWGSRIWVWGLRIGVSQICISLRAQGSAVLFAVEPLHSLILIAAPATPQSCTPEQHLKPQTLDPESLHLQINHEPCKPTSKIRSRNLNVKPQPLKPCSRSSSGTSKYQGVGGSLH